MEKVGNESRDEIKNNFKEILSTLGVNEKSDNTPPSETSPIVQSTKSRIENLGIPFNAENQGLPWIDTVDNRSLAELERLMAYFQAGGEKNEETLRIFRDKQKNVFKESLRSTEAENKKWNDWRRKYKLEKANRLVNLDKYIQESYQTMRNYESQLRVYKELSPGFFLDTKKQKAELEEKLKEVKEKISVKNSEEDKEELAKLNAEKESLEKQIKDFDEKMSKMTNSLGLGKIMNFQPDYDNNLGKIEGDSNAPDYKTYVNTIIANRVQVLENHIKAKRENIKLMETELEEELYLKTKMFNRLTDFTWETAKKTGAGVFNVLKSPKLYQGIGKSISSTALFVHHNLNPFSHNFWADSKEKRNKRRSLDLEKKDMEINRVLKGDTDIVEDSLSMFAGASEFAFSNTFVLGENIIKTPFKLVESGFNLFRKKENKTNVFDYKPLKSVPFSKTARLRRSLSDSKD
jgi:hypothetical protein